MIRRYLAVIMVMMLIGLSSPALAGDLVSPKLMAGLSVKGFPGRIAAFSLQGSGQAGSQSQSQAAPSHRHWTRGGKVLTFIGLAFVGGGAVMMTREVPDSEMVPGQTYVRWKRVGGISMGIGGALAIVGLTRRGD